MAGTASAGNDGGASGGARATERGTGTDRRGPVEAGHPGPDSAACSGCCSWSWLARSSSGRRPWCRPSARSRAIITLLVIAAILVGVGRRLRRTARSLDRIVEATRRVEAGDYTVRVGTPERSMRSVRDLSRGFDTMVERLAADERQRRSLLADVSHELRTPLTVIAGDIEAMIDGVHPADAPHLEAVLEETRVMRRLIEDLRTMALSEAGTLALHPEPTDPDVLIEEVVRSFEATAGTAGTDRAGRCPGRPADPRHRPGPDPGGAGQPHRQRDPPHAGRWLDHGPRHRRRRHRHRPGEWLEIRVIDTGPGIDPELLPHVFERFVSSAGSGGSGLGLSIARSLTQAHGGTLEVETTGSAGTTFRVRLPLP